MAAEEWSLGRFNAGERSNPSVVSIYQSIVFFSEISQIFGPYHSTTSLNPLPFSYHNTTSLNSLPSLSPPLPLLPLVTTDSVGLLLVRLLSTTSRPPHCLFSLSSAAHRHRICCLVASRRPRFPRRRAVSPTALLRSRGQWRRRPLPVHYRPPSLYGMGFRWTRTLNQANPNPNLPNLHWRQRTSPDLRRRWRRRWAGARIVAQNEWWEIWLICSKFLVNR